MISGIIMQRYFVKAVHTSPPLAVRKPDELVEKTIDVVPIRRP